MAKGRDAVSRTGSIAHFLLTPELSCSPPNEALINAYLELGYAVDLYAPATNWLIDCYRPECVEFVAPTMEGDGCCVMLGDRNGVDTRPFPVRARTRWPSSGCSQRFIGGLPLPWPTRSSRVAITGNRSEHWKRLCRFGMRRAKLTIVNTAERIDLQRNYAGIPRDHPFIVYPGGYREPPAPVDRSKQRRAWGIPEDAVVVGASGSFNLSGGADWLVEALGAVPDLHAVI